MAIELLVTAASCYRGNRSLLPPPHHAATATEAPSRYRLTLSHPIDRLCNHRISLPRQLIDPCCRNLSGLPTLPLAYCGNPSLPPLPLLLQHRSGLPPLPLACRGNPTLPSPSLLPQQPKLLQPLPRQAIGTVTAIFRLSGNQYP